MQRIQMEHKLYFKTEKILIGLLFCSSFTRYLYKQYKLYYITITF